MKPFNADNSTPELSGDAASDAEAIGRALADYAAARNTEGITFARWDNARRRGDTATANAIYAKHVKAARETRNKYNTYRRLRGLDAADEEERDELGVGRDFLPKFSVAIPVALSRVGIGAVTAFITDEGGVEHTRHYETADDAEGYAKDVTVDEFSTMQRRLASVRTIGELRSVMRDFGLSESPVAKKETLATLGGTRTAFDRFGGAAVSGFGGEPTPALARFKL